MYNCHQIQRPGSQPRVQNVDPNCVENVACIANPMESDSIQRMCRKCVTVVESSAQGPSPGSEKVSKVCNGRRIQRLGSRFWVQNVPKLWPVSQIQGPGSGDTALREKEPCAGGTKSEKSLRKIGTHAPVTLLTSLNGLFFTTIRTL